MPSAVASDGAMTPIPTLRSSALVSSPFSEGEPEPLGREAGQREGRRRAVVEREHHEHDERGEQERDEEDEVRPQQPAADPAGRGRALAAHVSPPPAVPVSRRSAPRNRARREHHHDDHRDQGEGQHRAVAPVRGVGEERLDGVAEELVARAADVQRGDELTGRRDQHEDEAGDHAGQAERQRDPEEGRDPAGAEVVRRLEQAAVHVLQHREHRQRHERDPAVEQHQRDREVGVDQPRHRLALRLERDVLDERVHDPVVVEDDLPGDDPQQVAREERRQQEQQQRVAVPAGHEREEVRQRIGGDRGRDDDQERDLQRVEELPAERVAAAGQEVLPVARSRAR